MIDRGMVMNSEEIKFLKQLLYNEDKHSVIIHLKKLTNSLFLHYFAANYHWDDGFDVPTAILENEACDFGTGLLLFYNADGYRMLENPNEVLTSSSEEWKNCLVKTMNKLIHVEFKTQDISFDPELKKVQKYKLKKNYPNLPGILINKSPGKDVEIPIL